MCCSENYFGFSSKCKFYQSVFLHCKSFSLSAETAHLKKSLRRWRYHGRSIMIKGNDLLHSAGDKCSDLIACSLSFDSSSLQKWRLNQSWMTLLPSQSTWWQSSQEEQHSFSPEQLTNLLLKHSWSRQPYLASKALTSSHSTKKQLLAPWVSWYSSW